MFNKKSFAAIAALGLAATAPAIAVPITGSLAPTDGFNPAIVGSTSIVSQLTQLNIGSTSTYIQPGGATGDLTAVGTLVAPNIYTLSSAGFDMSNPASSLIYSGNGFAFYVTSVTNAVRTALSCSAGTTDCSDSLVFTFGGYATGPAGFDQTNWAGTWTGNGSCQGTSTGCTSNTVANWSSSLTMTGRPVPEPGSLALLGLGLLGLGAARRRKA